MINKVFHVKVSYVTVKADYVSQRVDNFLLRHLKDMPHSRIYRMLRAGEVRVNKKRITAHYKLQIDDLLRIPPYWQSAPSCKTHKQPGSKLTNLLHSAVIFEDERILVINKPSGVAVHGGSGINFGVIEALRKMKTSWNALELVHRLDRDTSGCLILAKKRSALRVLHQLMREGKIFKKYILLVKGKWSGGKRTVDMPLLKSQLYSGERMVTVGEAGKQSITIFRPLCIGKEYSLLEAELKTGRTHQIRVHATSIGYPLAGDEKYGKREFKSRVKGQGLTRMFLHASSVKFCWQKGEQVKLQAELPYDLVMFLQTIFPDRRICKKN